ncbi:DUF2993 domain-containing protein [Frankia sp. AgB1.9]|uniref:LmeA family phospholipid-binding protein n=1 Tax=unclassified Frankia TaxID=2632575 RepID=UPI0019343937|nr:MULTISPECIES: DUF2993 domain-containing protein [unclassified Frankia]MBL7488345.1 DUF2993 domain-containing protein [Frankia sp. AgW1.1]MBL7548500.1 DUF2993 domain-containing protein [Frankia sp. AgB1.9]MBL7619603.1 DUF2993 domain-containing protein [Frankia sp. AgB1.8]
MNQERGADGQRPGDTSDSGVSDSSWGWRRPADTSSSRPGRSAQPAATGSFDEPGRPVRPTRPYDDHETGYPPGGSGGFGATLGQDEGGQIPPGGYGGTSAPEPSPWWRRRPPRLAMILGAIAMILILLFVIVDRIAVSVAESEMAKQLRTSVTQGLACGTAPPTVKNVSIGGFPFLTQILFGKFTNIGVTVENVPTPGPRIAFVQANLKGVHVPLHQILTNSVGEVRVDRIQATVRVRYDDLNTYLAGQPGDVQVNPTDGGRSLEITGTADVPIIGPQQVGGVTTFQIHDNQLTLVPTEITLRGALNLSIPLGGLGQLLPSIALPVGELPFRLTVNQASTDASGLSLTATAADVVLPKAAPPAPCKPAQG